MNKFLVVLIMFFGLNILSAQNFSTHQVKSGETIESIAKHYYVSVSEIYSLNPDAKNGLNANTILIIPISKAKKPNVEIVKELQGFQKHKTKRKETLYSLAKRYNVTEDEIKKQNTFLYANPLRRGDKLQIPIYKITEVEVAKTKPYTVLPKEGKWRIAYKFGIAVEALGTLNPGMGDVLKVGEVINVPNIEATEDVKTDDAYGYYKVLPKEGFYRLKLKLGLEQAELEALNPHIKETGLKNGMILKVPNANLNSDVIEEQHGVVNLANEITGLSSKHIAVMLPFRLNRVDFDSITDAKSSIKKDPYLNASLDFHSGVLMALDSLKKLGISIKVDVYDTKYQVSEVDRIINENNFQDVDAVIGPLTSKTFDKAAMDLRQYNVPVVSPIGKNLKLYENVFQSKPSTDLLKNKIVNFVKADSLVDNIVIISDMKQIEVANSLKREFNTAKVVYSRKDKKTGADNNYILINDVKSVLKPGKNVVFLETENHGFASNVTSILGSLMKSGTNSAIKIVLVTTHFNSAFVDDEVSNEHLSKLQFHYATTSKSYNRNSTFIKAYKNAYGITPDASAVKGFDLTMDVVLRLVSSNDLYQSVSDSPITEYVENKFAYKKKLYGGYYNDAVYLVKYDGLDIVEVKQ